MSEMPDRPGLEALIVSFIADELSGSSTAAIDCDENLFTGGYVDSVGIMRLIAHLESRLQIRIPPADLIPENFRSVRVMAAYLAARTADMAAAPIPPLSAQALSSGR